MGRSIWIKAREPAYSWSSKTQRPSPAKQPNSHHQSLTQMSLTTGTPALSKWQSYDYNCLALPQPPPSSPPPSAPKCRTQLQRIRTEPWYQSTANQKPAPTTTTAAPWPGATAEPHRPKTKRGSTTPKGGCRVPVVLTANEGARVPPPPGRHNLTATNQPTNQHGGSRPVKLEVG